MRHDCKLSKANIPPESLQELCPVRIKFWREYVSSSKESWYLSSTLSLACVSCTPGEKSSNTPQISPNASEFHERPTNQLSPSFHLFLSYLTVWPSKHQAGTTQRASSLLCGAWTTGHIWKTPLHIKPPQSSEKRLSAVQKSSLLASFTLGVHFKCILRWQLLCVSLLGMAWHAGAHHSHTGHTRIAGDNTFAPQDAILAHFYLQSLTGRDVVPDLSSPPQSTVPKSCLRALCFCQEVNEVSNDLCCLGLTQIAREVLQRSCRERMWEARSSQLVMDLRWFKFRKLQMKLS